MSWKARIGLVFPDDADCDDECFSMVPPGVSLHITRHFTEPLGYVPEADLDGQGRKKFLAAGHIEAAAKTLAPIHCDAAAYGCVSCSFVRDPGHDQRIITTIEKAAGCPATTGLNAFITALKTLQVTRVALVSPYDEARNEIFREILSAAGIRLVAIEMLKVSKEIRDFYESLGLYRLRHIRTPEVAYRLGRKVDRPDAQAIVIGSTNFNAGPMIEPLEEELGKPVITGNQAITWHALRLAGVQEPKAGFGRLLRTRLEERVTNNLG